MSTTLYPATPEMSRDEAAEILQKRKIHHACRLVALSWGLPGSSRRGTSRGTVRAGAKVINVRDVQCVTHK